MAPRWPLLVGTGMAPFTAMLAFWIWLGRGFAGSTIGWLVFAIPLYGALPLLGLLLPALFVILRDRRGIPTTMITRVEAATQLVVWLIMLAVGLTVVDITDVGAAQSVLMHAGIPLTYATSERLVEAELWALAASDLVLLVLTARSDPPSPRARLR